jgi:hypothetical protein
MSYYIGAQEKDDLQSLLFDEKPTCKVENGILE